MPDPGGPITSWPNVMTTRICPLRCTIRTRTSSGKAFSSLEILSRFPRDAADWKDRVACAHQKHCGPAPDCRPLYQFFDCVDNRRHTLLVSSQWSPVCISVVLAPTLDHASVFASVAHPRAWGDHSYGHVGARPMRSGDQERFAHPRA